MLAKYVDQCRILTACCASEVLPVTFLDCRRLDLPEVRGALGWCSREPNEYIRSELTASGHWDGESSLIVLNVEALENTADEYGLTAEQAVWQTVVHEIAHLVPREAPAAVRTVEPDVGVILDHQVQFEAIAERPTHHYMRPWSGHGAAFTRYALHGWHRATEAGFDVPLEGLCAGMAYRLAPAWRYLEALGSEPQRMFGLPFTLIANEPAPDAFLELFQDDVDFYEHFHGEIS